MLIPVLCVFTIQSLSFVLSALLFPPSIVYRLLPELSAVCSLLRAVNSPLCVDRSALSLFWCLDLALSCLLFFLFVCSLSSAHRMLPHRSSASACRTSRVGPSKRSNRSRHIDILSITYVPY
jgi:hypothetical protein